MIKIVIVVVLLFVIISLFGALRTLVRNKEGDKRKTVRFLAWRVGLSVLLLVLLGVATLMGWISPHGLNPVVSPSAQIQQVE